MISASILSRFAPANGRDPDPPVPVLHGVGHRSRIWDGVVDGCGDLKMRERRTSGGLSLLVEAGSYPWKCRGVIVGLGLARTYTVDPILSYFVSPRGAVEPFPLIHHLHRPLKAYFVLQMAPQDNGQQEAVHQGETVEQNDRMDRGTGGTSQVNIHNYFGPVNHVGQAKGCSLGINHGSITSNEHRVTSGGSPDGTPVTEDQRREGSTITVHRLPNGQIDLFAMLNPITDASHTRNLDLSPPHSQCFKGTRKRVLKKIRSWVNSSMLLSNPHILWVYGYAGCGKSAIALAIAKHFASEKRLAASFFFFKGTNRSSVARFATTVAHQVAATVPAAAPFIEAALGKNPALVSMDTPVDVQFESLVYGPINSVKWDRFAASLRHGPYLIVFDGVDECEDRQAVANFIEHMIQYFEKKPFIPLRILITSRVEDHLHRRLHSSKQVQLLDLVNHTSDADILAALDVAITNEKRGLVLKCADSWPSQEDKAKLIKHIGGSYIFMTTIVKLLFDRNIQDGRTPMERLPQVLSTRPDFDDLYKSILKAGQGLRHFHNVISIIALALEPLSIAQISDILDIKAASVANVLLNLHAIMHVPGDDRTPVTLCHTSLRDFLTSQNRSGPFYASPFDHIAIARGCILRAVNPGPSATREYARRYAMKHLDLIPIQENGTYTLNAATLEGLQTHLNKAIFEGMNWKLVRALVEARVNVNVRFKDNGRSNVVTPLHGACRHEEFNMIYFLLENGADPNVSDVDADFNDGTPLNFASYKGDIKLVTRLLECGADPNLQGGYYGTALQAACCKGKLEVVNLLLEHGAYPNLTGNAWTSPLYTCAINGYVDCARALLEHKADPNVRDKDGETSLHGACYWGYTKVAELLLDFGADPTNYNQKPNSAQEGSKTASIVLVSLSPRRAPGVPRNCMCHPRLPHGGSDAKGSAENQLEGFSVGGIGWIFVSIDFILAEKLREEAKGCTKLSVTPILAFLIRGLVFLS
ncbi:hypothetical protein NMY22_g3287 [Coprinellus aureogranulatus]|nr:hypothetical protein NMY22_g3287 [Coprinellus aureogranulatus]